MASLRISIPIDSQTETDRQDFILRIHSIADWRKCLNVRPRRKTRTQLRSPNDSPRGTQQYRRQRMGKEHDVPSMRNSSESHDGSSPPWGSEASGWSHSTVSTDVGQLNDHTPLDEETLKIRMETLQILEGSKKPLPHQDGPGVYTQDFERFKQEEARKDERRHSFVEFQRVLRSPQSSACGWPFLYSIIVKFLEFEAAMSFPTYCAGQQVFLLTIKKLDDGREMVADARNLNTCSNADLVKRMAEVEKRDWRDVLWVSNQKQEFPKMVKMDKNAEELDWGHLSMI